MFADCPTELEAKIKPWLAEFATIDLALRDAEDQLKLCREWVWSLRYDDTKADPLDREAQQLDGSAKVFEQLLAKGRSKKACPTCTRGLKDDQMRVFEKTVGVLPSQHKRNLIDARE